MNIEAKNLPESHRRYAVELSIQEVRGYFEHALAHLAESVKVPGFRKGKAPVVLVKQNIDQTKLREEAYSLAVSAAWKEIIDKLTDLPIQDPEVALEEFEEGKSAKVIFEFDVRPQVRVGKWQDIKLKKTNEEEVSEDDVNQLIQSLQQAHAKTVAKLEPAQKGDKVHVDFEGSLNNVKQDKLSGKNFPLVIGHSNTIPGFDEQLIGLKKGDKKVFKLKFPTDHFDKNLASQQIEFQAEIQEVFDVILPELNDEFAKGFGHTKTEQLTKAIREDIGNRKKDEQFINQKARFLAEFEKLVKTDVPKTLIETEVARSREQWRNFLQQRMLNQETWLKDRDLTMEQLEADWVKAARSSVTIGLGLAEVSKELKKELKSNEDFQALLDDLVRKACSR